MEKLEFITSAVFYKRRGDDLLKEKLIRAAFQSASKDKCGPLYGGRFIIQEKCGDIHYSFCAFKKRMKPSCFKDMPETTWLEVKFAYVLIVEYNGYVAISRKYVPQLKAFELELKEVDYSRMSSAFITDTTKYQKVVLKNLDMSVSAIRGKSLEAVNLQESFSTTGANNFIVNQCRLNNNDDIISLSLNSSKVNYWGNKDGIYSFIYWVKDVVDCFANCIQRKSLLSAFAESVDYDSHRHNLIPASILFYTNELLSAFENKTYIKMIYKSGNVVKECRLQLTNLLKKLDHVIGIEKVNNDYLIYTDTNKALRKSIKLELAKGKIKLSSNRLKLIHLVKQDNETLPLVDYLNSTSPFVVYFDQFEYRYSN